MSRLYSIQIFRTGCSSGLMVLFIQANQMKYSPVQGRIFLPFGGLGFKQKFFRFAGDLDGRRIRLGKKSFGIVQ